MKSLDAAQSVNTRSAPPRTCECIIYFTHTRFRRNFLSPLPSHPSLTTQKENLFVRMQT